MALSVSLSLCSSLSLSLSPSFFLFPSAPSLSPFFLDRHRRKYFFFSIFGGIIPQKPDVICIFLFNLKSRNPEVPNLDVAAANKHTSEHVADSGLKTTVTG